MLCMALYVTQHAYTHIRIHLDPLHDTLSTIYQSMFNYAYSVQCTHNTLITTSITFNQTYVRTSYTHNTCITGPHTAHQPKHLSICVQSGIQCTHTTPVSLANTQLINDSILSTVYVRACSIRDTVYTHNTCITGPHTAHNIQQ